LNEARYIGKQNAKMHKKLRLLFSEDMPNDLVYFISNLSEMHKKLLALCKFLSEFNSKDKIIYEYDDPIDFRDAFSSPTIYFAAQVEAFKTELKTTLPVIKKSSQVSNPDKLVKELLGLEIILIKLQEDLAKQIDKIIILTNELTFAKRRLTLGGNSSDKILDWARKLRKSKEK
jgi:hypothetical protein